MGNGEEVGYFESLWNKAKKVLCTILCAWFEILVAVVVLVTSIVLLAVVFFAFFIGVAGDSLLVALSGGIGAPIGIGILVVMIIIVLILFIMVFILVALVMEWLMQKVRRCWNSC